jgi:hypothetical protein
LPPATTQNHYGVVSQRHSRLSCLAAKEQKEGKE